jgi:hypothetical protein
MQTQSRTKNAKELTEDDLDNIPELHPPQFMPNGNVGTPSSVFLELIQQCRLPSKIISSLKLTFPKSTTVGVYSNVTFDYGKDGKSRGMKVFGGDKSRKHSSGASHRRCATVTSDRAEPDLTAGGSLKSENLRHELETDEQPKHHSSHEADKHSDEERKQSESEEVSKTNI